MLIKINYTVKNCLIKLPIAQTKVFSLNFDINLHLDLMFFFNLVQNNLCKK